MTDDSERDDQRELDEYACIAETWVDADATYGETTTAVFDSDVLDVNNQVIVFRELLDAMEADGYELVGFGTVTDEIRMNGSLHERFTGAPVGIFVYRGR